MGRTGRAGLLLAGLLAAECAAAQSQSPVVTIYSTARPGAVEPHVRVGDAAAVPGYGVIQERKTLQLPMGVSELRYPGVPAAIDPSSVRVRSLTDPGMRVLQQRFEFDFSDTQSLLQRYLGEDIVVEQVRDGGVVATEGRLVAVLDALVLEQADGSVQLIRDYDNLRFSKLSVDLVTRPTLMWTIDTGRAGRHDVSVTYETRGLTWWADYGAVVREDEGCRLDLDGWATVLNYSGAEYTEAQVRLVAGEPHRAGGSAPVAFMEARVADAREQGAAAQRLSEYHLYTLERPAVLPRHTATQVPLLEPVTDVECTKRYVFDALEGRWPRGSRPLLEPQIGNQGGGDVNTFLEFRNGGDVGLGIPLAAGRVRVSQVSGGDAAASFIGEDAIGHTAAGEDVRLRLGSAFDLSAERRQVDFRVDTDRQVLEEEIEISLRNAKDEAVTIDVEEQLFRWANWTMVKHSTDFEAVDARTIRFPVEVPAEGEAQVRYRVRYTW